MKTVLFAVLGIGAGAAITFQSSLSGQLSRRLSNPMISSASVYLVGFVVLLAILAMSNHRLPTWDLVKETPRHLWLVGGVVSAGALSCVYWLMPQVGVSSTMLYVLTGQLITSAVIGHFAWFGFVGSPLSFQRVVALLLVLGGVVLFNAKSINA